MWKQQEMGAFLQEAAGRGIVPGLETMENLMEELGNVQDKLAVIHVAGTNGKGSVCAMTERILRLAGYRTGWYSSPQVFSREEQYWIEGEAIPPGELWELFYEVGKAAGRLKEKGLGQPTLFEIETAAAFLCFYRKKCDVALIEVGMGGRLDATNIIRKPLCSVITSVSRDHMKFLGETLKEIAGEKAGIIKEGCPVVCAPQEKEAETVIEEVCRRKGSGLYRVLKEDISGARYVYKERSFDAQETAAYGEPSFDAQEEAAHGEAELEFFYRGRRVRLSLLGACQSENAACALGTAEFLRKWGFSIREEQMFEGLRSTRWPGRFEVVCREPFTVLDGAHNVDAAKKLRKTLEMGFTNRAIIYIIGVLADKEYEKLLEIMLPLAKRVFTVTPESERALPGEVLCQAASKLHSFVVHAASIKEAWIRAKETARVLEYAGEKPMILVFGSLSYLGKMKQIMTGSDENDR